MIYEPVPDPSAALEGLRQRWTQSYKEEARSDVLLLMEDLKKGQPPKYVLALEQLIDGVREFPLVEPAGPDDA